VTKELLNKNDEMTCLWVSRTLSSCRKGKMKAADHKPVSICLRNIRDA
jgi:hypothetical protein